ncbi:MAG: penicillin-binding transpeptidase domain-containing protein [Candidatus Krumholzibacteria bacterium]|nr:penicillin-binding transpeptidase domain-containing protein [Candidatus Krumholzibacteria bacterium]
MMSSRFSEWRIRLVSAIVAITVCVLVYRIIQVQIIQHKAYKALAEDQQTEEQTWPARRGAIYDRNGYPLAVSHTTYTIGVTPRDFPKDESCAAYLAGVVGKKTSAIKRLLSRKDSYILLAKDIDLTAEQEARLSSLPGLKLDTRLERLNPMGAMTPAFVGSIDREGNGVSGIEQAFQNYLKGADGWLIVNRDAKSAEFRLINSPGKEPVDGCDVYLTIDSGIQSIVDFELEQAVESYGAKGGAAIVVDPDCGDILAISEKCPGSGSGLRVWKGNSGLYSTTCMYEPGSTFKLVTDAYLLESGRVDPYDVFYGEKGKADFDFGRFTDDHEFEWLTFKESFTRSSNICTIKAIMDSDRRDFYTFMLNMGFGGRTGIDLPAESKGILRDPKEWSGRSMASISIGQEIGVTAMQMAMAYGALANGGTLMTPRVALEVARPGEGPVVSYPSIRMRKVFSDETARTMIDFCKGVVKDGTGINAQVEGIETAGKTGTAQKSEGRGYVEGKYIASFIGFAPADAPQLVCLVLLDEPEQNHYYGGSSAAVVFRRIIEGINLSTDLLVDPRSSVMTMADPKANRSAVPSFLRLNLSEAEILAARHGFRVDCTMRDGEVFAQIPEPGTYADPGSEISLALRSSPHDASQEVCVPDLLGLPVRKARRMLIECGLAGKIEGYGLVESQVPEPGSMAGQGTNVTLSCNPLNYEDQKEEQKPGEKPVSGAAKTAGGH